MSNIELKPCPFCGNAIKETKGLGNVTFFICSYERCGAVISFSGKKRIHAGVSEAENPRENFNRRTENDPK